MAFKYHVVEGKNIKTGAAMSFAMADPVDVVKLEGICEEVSHACTVTKADVMAILTELEYVFIRMMRSNKSVHFGFLGSFRTSPDFANASP